MGLIRSAVMASSAVYAVDRLAYRNNNQQQPSYPPPQQYPNYGPGSWGPQGQQPNSYYGPPQNGYYGQSGQYNGYQQQRQWPPPPGPYENHDRQNNSPPPYSQPPQGYVSGQTQSDSRCPKASSRVAMDAVTNGKDSSRR